MALARSWGSRWWSSSRVPSRAAIQGGPALGIDFSGGTSPDPEVRRPGHRGCIVRRRHQRGIAEESGVQQFGPADDNELLIRAAPERTRRGAPVSSTGPMLSARRSSRARSASSRFISQELVGPVIGEVLKRRGVSAFGFALAGILVYIGLRFRFSFAAGAIIAVAHDVLVTLRDADVLRLRAVPERGRGDADDHRVFGERLDRGLRPGPGKSPAYAEGQFRHARQREHQPDPEPDDHHLRHDPVRGDWHCLSSVAKCYGASPSR